jgi:hypothetical protein
MLTGIYGCGNATCNPFVAQRARRCAQSTTSAPAATMPAAHDLAERFAAYTDQLPLAACRLTRHKQSANRAP